MEDSTKKFSMELTVEGRCAHGRSAVCTFGRSMHFGAQGLQNIMHCTGKCPCTQEHETRADTVKTEPSAFQMPHLRSHPHVLAG